MVRESTENRLACRTDLHVVPDLYGSTAVLFQNAATQHSIVQVGVEVDLCIAGCLEHILRLL